MDKTAKNSDDFLESSVLLDETHYNDGFKEGHSDGLVFGKEEGKEIALKMGFQVREEFGFYRGCVDVWMSFLSIDQKLFSAGTRKSIEQLSELLDKYPLSEPENENVQEMMDAIRLKFKLISANLGVKFDYEGFPTSSKQDGEDI